MASGIVVNPKVLSLYKELDKRMHFAMTMRLNDSLEELIPERTFPVSEGKEPEQQWKDVIDTLPENECRFLICDFPWRESGTVIRSKVCAIHWAPDDAQTRPKMIYATTKETLMKQVNVDRSVQATEIEELTYKTIKDVMCK